MTVRAALAACMLLQAGLCCAQPTPAAPPETKVMSFAGAPLRVEYKCSDEDMQAAGLHCTEDEPCRVYLELVAVEPVGARVFLAGNLHTESVTIQSVLLASQDSGRSWSEPFERLRGGTLDRIHFFDYDTGWAAGQLVQPLPRDPFLLLTTDGGATWRRRPVFSESRPGAVENFQFKSRTEGTLWIDRTQSGESGALYERYESSTGGESWTLRDAGNRPPAAAPDAARERPGWRIRADAKSQSFRLERAQESGWQLVAAFSFLAGECRPALQPLPEPPELPPEPPPSKSLPARKKR
ncbi:MAG: exo-alpha-sialidase [Bryobacterales bacterium]|nr:exo-alpha-sialidase [Bryobacterales bacterium]